MSNGLSLIALMWEALKPKKPMNITCIRGVSENDVEIFYMVIDHRKNFWFREQSNKSNFRK